MSWHIKIQVIRHFPSSGEEQPDETRKIYIAKMGAVHTINALFASILELVRRLHLLSPGLNDPK